MHFNIIFYIGVVALFLLPSCNGALWPGMTVAGNLTTSVDAIPKQPIWRRDTLTGLDNLSPHAPSHTRMNWLKNTAIVINSFALASEDILQRLFTGKGVSLGASGTSDQLIKVLRSIHSTLSDLSQQQGLPHNQTFHPASQAEAATFMLEDYNENGNLVAEVWLVIFSANNFELARDAIRVDLERSNHLVLRNRFRDLCKEARNIVALTLSPASKKAGWVYQLCEAIEALDKLAYPDDTGATLGALADESFKRGGTAFQLAWFGWVEEPEHSAVLKLLQQSAAQDPEKKTPNRKLVTDRSWSESAKMWSQFVMGLAGH